MKSICHIAAPPRNFGDAALVWGLHKRLREEATEELRFVMVDIQATQFTDMQIDLINDSFDAILVGGGGLVMNRADVGNETRSGWQWDITREQLWQIQIPLIVYAIGFNQLPFASTPVTDEALKHLEDVAGKAHAFSFRDEQSAWACKMPKADVVPDPALWVEAYSMTDYDWPGRRRRIGVNIAGDRPEQRWSDPSAEDKLHKNIRKAIRHGNNSAYLIPHHPDDVAKSGSPDIVPSYLNVPLLAGVYQAMDVVIGMRGHANIIAAAVGTPPISIGHQAKNQWFMESVGLAGQHIPDDAKPDDIRKIIADAKMAKVPAPNYEFDRSVINAI